jgi:hypothetical protein
LDFFVYQLILMATSSFTSANFASPVVLDSGTSYTALPASVFDYVANWFGVINDADYGYLIRCNISSYPGTLDYGFGGPKGPRHIIQIRGDRYPNLSPGQQPGDHLPWLLRL